MKRLFPLCVIFLMFNVSHIEAENSWHFPLEIKAGLSSNFGEFRGNRVHTGVDLRTNGITGYKVYAIDGGTIVRLSVKKRGFGNALYIQHPNGLMTVYAHLDRFAEKSLGLQTFVKKHQRQRKTRYPGNIYLEKPVKRGQLIGYSGETGYGLPHLHFELRRGGATPIDPFEHGFEYEDKTQPVIESLVIEPLGSQSFLEGEHFSREYRTEKQQGKYLIGQIPRLRGKVRFTASAYDQIGAKNKCNVDRIDLYIAYSGVDKLDLYIDREKFFSNQFDLVTYKTNHRGGLVYDFNLTRLSNPTQYYYRLYNISPALFPYRQVFAKNKGVWDTTMSKEGLHTIMLEIRDVGGNLSVAQMQVYVEKEHVSEKTSHNPPLKRGDKSNWRMEVRDFRDFLEVFCQSTVPLREAPVLQITRRNSAPVMLTMQRVKTHATSEDSESFTATYDLRPGKDGVLNLTVSATTRQGKLIKETRSFPVHTIFAKRGGSVSYGKKASMSFPPGALYEDIFANIFPTSYYKATKGLPLISEVYDFRPAGCPLEKKGSIRIQYPSTIKNPKKLGIFWWDNIKQRWYFMDDKIEAKTRNLTAKIIYPSIYAVLQDNVNPVISNLIPEPGSRVKSSLSTLSAKINDVGKGVDENSIIITLDGKRIDGEYDPDRSKVKFTLTKKLPSGKHTLTVQASDKAGNPAKLKTSTFNVQ